jgi:cholesterol transport system auxiliary component
MASFRTAVRVAGVAAGTLGLGACVNLGSAKPPAQLFTLQAASPAPAGYDASARPAETLLVQEPEADRILAAPRIAAVVDDSRVAYLKGGQWVERPSRQFAALLAEVLRARGHRLVLREGDAMPANGTRLTGQLLALGYDARLPGAVVRFDALRRGPDGRISTHRFEAVERGVKPNAGAVAEALGRLANTVASEVADWLN